MGKRVTLYGWASPLTLQPSRSKRSVNSFPYPDATPVIKATFPGIFMVFFNLASLDVLAGVTAAERVSEFFFGGFT